MEIANARTSDVDVDVFWEKSLSIHARRLELIASNIANADTPNFKARDLDFKAALTQAMKQPEAQVHSQRRGAPLSNDPLLVLYRVPSQASADNNTVDMDVERAAFAEAAIRYEFAVQQVSEKYKSMEKLFASTPF